MKHAALAVAVVAAAVMTTVSARGNCPAIHPLAKYDPYTNQCSADPRDRSYLEQLDASSVAELVAEDVGLSRRAKTITVAGKHAALVVLAHKKGQYGGKVDGNWIIKNGDRANNKDYQLLCCDDDNKAVVTRKATDIKEAVTLKFVTPKRIKAKDIVFDVLVVQRFGSRGEAYQTKRIICTYDKVKGEDPVEECIDYDLL